MNQRTPILPWLLVTLPALLLLFTSIHLGSKNGWNPNAELLDLLAESVLMAILLLWIRTASILKRQQRTYWVFILGVFCLVWLMILKMVAEYALVQPLGLQILETVFAIAGVTLLSFGIAAWGRDYRILIEETEEKKNQYKQLSLTDALTQLPNRAAYNKQIQRLTSQKTDYILVLADLDHFKQINDQHGHDAGDAALQQVSKTLRASCRGDEECFRIGGEEFAIFLTQCTLEQAKDVAERVRLAIESTPVAWQDSTIQCTVSIGLCFSQQGESPQTTYRHADAALYQAKQEGRNRVVVSS